MSIKAILSFVAGLFLSFTIHASEIDKRLVGVWEGQRDENGKCPFMAWEFKRFENGRFEVIFFRNRSKIRNILNTETGTWTTEGSKYILNTDDVPNPDAYIYNVNENWNYLYNDVRWEGDELHYQNFAYSTKPSLFTHPFHKSMHRSILAPLEDANRIKHSFFIGNKRFDSILIKVE